MTYRNIRLFASTIALAIASGCATQSEVRVAPQAPTPTPCLIPGDVKIHLFHTMYKDLKSAEDAYSRIASSSPSTQLSQLMAIARKESIDQATMESGGDLGFIKEGEFELSFEKAVFALPKNFLSRPIHSSFGWHVVWVTEKMDARTNTSCP